MKAFSRGRFVMAREILEDVGRRIATNGEQQAAGWTA